MSCLVLGVRLFPSDRWFFGGLTLSRLRTTQVLSACQYPQQLLGPHIKSLTHSLAIPSLKYFCDIFSQTAAANMWVGPFLGLWARQGALGTGRTERAYNPGTPYNFSELYQSSIILAG